MEFTTFWNSLLDNVEALFLVIPGEVKATILTCGTIALAIAIKRAFFT